MNRITVPAQTVELRTGGAWVDVTDYVDGFVVPRWEVEQGTGKLVADQVTMRIHVTPMESGTGLTVQALRDAAEVGLRLTYMEAGPTVSGGDVVFVGRVVEIARRTVYHVGDVIDITALDRLAVDTVAPTSVTGTGLMHYSDVLEALSGAAGLSVATAPPLSLESTGLVVSHHPLPTGDASTQARALAWWSAESMMVMGVGEELWGYSPSTRQSYRLAVPPWPQSATPPRQIDRLWIVDDDIYGVSLASRDADPGTSSYIIHADLSSFSAAVTNPSPVTYTADEAFKRWNAGTASIQARELYYLSGPSLAADYGARCYVIGAAGPEYDGLGRGVAAFEDGSYSVAPRQWILQLAGQAASASPGGGGAYYESDLTPDLWGRNLYLADETEVDVEYAGSGRRQAEVVCYRMPGPLSYYIPKADWSGTDGAVRDYGSGEPHAERVGTLPLTLPPGYYSFISAGQAYDPGIDPGTKEQVDSFSITFSRPARGCAAVYTDVADNPLTAEDDAGNLDGILGPLAYVDDDEFERLYIRDVSGSSRVAVKGFPDRCYDVHLARANATTVYVAMARDVGLVGAYGRQEPLVVAELGVASGSGSDWTYSQLYQFDGWDDTLADNEDSHSHYVPTCLAYGGGKLHVGLVETVQRFTGAGVRVRRAFTAWDEDDGTYYPGRAYVYLEGWHPDDFEVGQRIRLWPDDTTRFPYPPLPRTITAVEYTDSYHDEFQTRLTVSPVFDVSDGGETDPAERTITPSAGKSYGVEEWRAEMAFDWGPPTLQVEGAREQRTRLYQYTLASGVLEQIDSGLETGDETITASDDGREAVLELSNDQADESTIAVSMGGTTLAHRVDTDHLKRTGEGRIYLPRRYAGLNVDVDYDYWAPDQRFTAATYAGGALYYTRGRELRSYVLSITKYGDVHYQASGVASPLVIPPSVPTRVYCVTEGAGSIITQLSSRLSGYVGDRSGWTGRAIPACIEELALALGCVFWADAQGGVHFVPRGWRRKTVAVDGDEILDYTEPGPDSDPVTAASVSWPGGVATSGYTSATRPERAANYTADLVTSGGWAGLLADHLLGETASEPAEVILRDLRLDLWIGDALKIPLSGAAGANEGAGTIVGIAPDPDGGLTVLTLR